MRSTARLLGLLLPYILFLAFGLVFFPSTGRDDSHITYWSAYALSNFGEIVNYSGLRVEQSSSLLQTLILAAVHRVIGIDIVDIGTPLSALAGLTAIYLTGRLAVRINADIASEAQLLTATFLSLVYWSFGGMEATLVSVLVLLLALALADLSCGIRARTVAFLVLAMIGYLLVRPETYFITVALFVALAVWRRPANVSIGNIGYLFCLASIVFGAIMLWRWSYFGAVFPQPVTAKIGVSWIGRFIDGIDYLIQSGIDHPTIFVCLVGLLIGGLMVFRGCDVSAPFVIVLSFALAQTAAVVAVGGDWMEGGRFIVPIAPLMIIVLLSLLARRATWYGASVVVVLGVNIISLFVFAQRASPSIPIFYYERYASKVENRRDYSIFELANRLHIRDTKFIDRLAPIVADLLAEKPQVTILSTQAGMIFYRLAERWYGQVTFVDLPSLVSRDFSTCSENAYFARGAGGLSLDYDFLSGYPIPIFSACMGEPPDVIFDLDYASFRRVGYIREMGYKLIYQQTGTLQLHQRFPGETVGAEQFIMVRRALADKAGLKFHSERF